jgi:plastocyanin
MTASVGVVETSRAFQFSPANVTVAPGGTVSFSWSDTAQFHDVVVRSGGGELGRSGDPAKSGSFSYTFSAPGTYQFVCEVHEASIPPMRGTVTVQ